MPAKQLFSTAQVAEALGVHKSTVTRAANVHQIGQQVGGIWLFAQSDVKRLRSKCRLQVGNPNFGQKKQKRW